MAGEPWAPEETEWLCSHMGRMSTLACAEELGRPFEEVEERAYLLKTAKARKRGAPWTPAEVDYLREHYPDEGGAAVARALGVRRQRVFRKAKELGLKRSGPWVRSTADAPGRGNAWRTEELVWLLRHPRLTDEQAARGLGRTPGGVRIQRRSLAMAIGALKALSERRGGADGKPVDR